MKRGFDRIARYYDALARIVFGKSITDSQTNFLRHLHKCSSVLVLGGGTGWWLKDLLIKSPHLQITFADTSKEMIRLARKNTGDNDRVEFIQGSLESVPAGQTFDAVILFFILDMFKDDELKTLTTQIQLKLKSEAIWLVTDFVDDKRWHYVLLKVMYTFFRLVAGLKTKSLPDWRRNLGDIGQKIDERYFYRGFICSSVYQSNC